VGKTKATKTQQDLYVRQIMQWLVEGWDRQMILKEGRTQWGYTGDGSIDALIKRARQEFVVAWEETDRKEYIAQLSSRFDHIYRLGLSQRQLAVSHAAALAQAKIMGVTS